MALRLLPLRMLLGPLALGLLAVPRASAEPIPWTYQGQVVTTGPSSGPLGQPLGPHVLVATDFPDGTAPNSSNQAQFADVPGSGSGSSSVTAFQQRAYTDFGEVYFGKGIHTFDLNFAIRDAASGTTGSVTFQGYLSGSMHTFREDLNASVPSGGVASVQVGFSGAGTQALVLGGHLYQVSVSPFAFQFEQNFTPGLQFPVTSPYQGVPVSVQVSDVPEPSTVALAAVGLAGLAVRCWRRRTQQGS